MIRRVLVQVAIVLAAAGVATAVNVSTPKGSVDVFARGDLFDLPGLLRLAGADVQFATAAGSYTATGSGHEVQFTPGGTLALVDGKLQPLPGPVRVLENHVVGSLATAGALLAPFGWVVRGTAAAPELGLSVALDRIQIDLVRSEAAPLIVLRGTAQRPRLVGSAGTIRLEFSTGVVLAQPVAAEGELQGASATENTLTIRLALGVEVASSYPLENPPRFVLRLAKSEAPGATTTRREGPLVVLDPGHGGEDHGAKAPGGELEKDVALAVARATAARLTAAGVTARLTRDADETVPLADRTALANRLKADVFVSIHANASTAKGARGAETYFMNSDASDTQAAQAAARENASAKPDTVQLILWDLAYVANLNASARLAQDVQERLNALQGIRDRGIRQAPFVVLTGATMPASLVEIGFLSNPEDASRLAARESQDQVAGALAEAIVAFVRTPQPQPSPTP